MIGSGASIDLWKCFILGKRPREGLESINRTGASCVYILKTPTSHVSRAAVKCTQIWRIYIYIHQQCIILYLCERSASADARVSLVLIDSGIMFMCP